MRVLSFTNYIWVPEKSDEAERFGESFLAQMIFKTLYSHFRSHSNHIVENYYSGVKYNEKINDVAAKPLFALYKVAVIWLLALHKMVVISLFTLYIGTKCQ